LDAESVVVVEVNVDGRGLVIQAVFYQKGVPFHIQNRIGILPLIQSESQARPPSASGKIHPDGGYFLPRKVHIQLLLCGFTQLDHEDLLGLG